MKFIFNFLSSTTLTLSLLSSAGCRRGEAARTPAPADGGDAQRLVALLDYVGGDYSLAVKDGVVASPAEYEEQLRFLSDARAIAERLLRGAAGSNDALLGLLADLDAQVRAKAAADSVAQACQRAREEVVTRFGLRTMPTERPSLAQAEALYVQNCASCHGTRGDGLTERRKELNPPPANFRDPERLRDLSPYRVYNALTFGVPGTAMASFEALSPANRWSLAFYVFRLGHDGRPVSGPAALPLADMAGRSDREILDALRADAHPFPAAGLSYIRREAAFREPPAGVGIDRTRVLLTRALAALEAGRAAEADRLVLDAYLQGFEPLEPRLRARDAEATLAIESAFRDLRAGIMHNSAPDVHAKVAVLDHLLARLSQGGPRPIVPFLAAFLIYFREGIEAALLVGALLAGVRRLGHPDAARFIHTGWVAALLAGLLTWWVAGRLVALGADQKELVEGVVSLLAAVVLFSVSFWMISKAESRHWMGYLKRSLERSLSRRSLALLSGLAFLAVYREAAETVLFYQALLLESGARTGEVGGGAAAGLASVAAAAYAMNRTVLRLPLGLFFAVSSALLCALAISFAGAGIYELVAAGYLPPRPVTFPEVPWMGIHPDLTGLLVQLTIVAIIAAAGLASLRRRASEELRRNR